MNTRSLTLATASLALLSATSLAHATTTEFTFSGAGTYGDLALTYGSVTDPRYASGFLVTGATGTFSDSNIGLTGIQVTGVQPLNISAPESTNMFAPADFSHYNVASGLQHGTFLSFDDLFYPTGSPQTATDYPFHGGPFDIYGVLLTLSNGELLNVWSNGLTPGATAIDYGVAVVTSATALDYVQGGVANTPEPNTLALLGTGTLASISLLRRRLHR